MRSCLETCEGFNSNGRDYLYYSHGNGDSSDSGYVTHEKSRLEIMIEKLYASHN